MTRPPPAIGDKTPRGRLARTCGRDSSTSRRGGVGGGGGCGGTGGGGSGRCGAPRAKNERNVKGALLRFARGDAVGEGAGGAALGRGEPRGGDAAAAAAEGAALAARPGEVAAWYDLGCRPPAPNLPGFGRFTGGADTGCSKTLAPAGSAPAARVAENEKTDTDNVTAGSTEPRNPPVGIADAHGANASRMRITEMPSAVPRLKRARPKYAKASSAQNCSA